MNRKSAHDADEDRMYYQDSLLATAEEGEALSRIATDWVAEKVRNLIQKSGNE